MSDWGKSVGVCNGHNDANDEGNDDGYDDDEKQGSLTVLESN